MRFLKSNFVIFLACIIAIRILDERIAFKLGQSNDDDKVLLVFGVLSAQNNSAARDSIRYTWKTLTEKSHFKFYFLIGDDFCPIHPEDRMSGTSCEPLMLVESPEKPLIRSMWTPYIIKNRLEGVTRSVVTSFTFRVNFPVILRGIRVLKIALQDSVMAFVNLKNARTGNVITSMSFEAPRGSLFKDEDDWLEVQPNSFLLPKSFDAELQFLTKTSHNESYSENLNVKCYGLSAWLNFSGGIKYTTQYGLDTGWVTFNENACTPVSLLLELHDIDKYLDQRQARSHEWQNQIASLSKSLEIEAMVEKDILFLDVLDVYSNIPKKLLKFYEWMDKNLNFLFLLKADDDTFINVPIVEHYLSSLVNSDEDFQRLFLPWWWGKLRLGLPVERHGKWQELVYAAPIYPPFPCGGAYIINKNVVEFLATTSRWLNFFQGEDTSLGIWLSGVHPLSPSQAICHWSCGRECDAFSCNRGQLSIDEMYSVWQIYKKNQRLC